MHSLTERCGRRRAQSAALTTSPSFASLRLSLCPSLRLSSLPSFLPSFLPSLRPRFLPTFSPSYLQSLLHSPTHPPTHRHSTHSWFSARWCFRFHPLAVHSLTHSLSHPPKPTHTHQPVWCGTESEEQVSEESEEGRKEAQKRGESCSLLRFLPPLPCLALP